ncbi:hypothetical protein KC361_g2 [Hortaea werneckii]|nr:hypothetical protein KC361_g2 [Hortaea werneckii]
MGRRSRRMPSNRWGCGQEGGPVRLEDVPALLLAQMLAQSVLVHHAVFVGVRVEHGGSDPWLKNEPTAQVDTADLLLAPSDTTSWVVKSLGDSAPVLILALSTESTTVRLPTYGAARALLKMSRASRNNGLSAAHKGVFEAGKQEGRSSRDNKSTTLRKNALCSPTASFAGVRERFCLLCRPWLGSKG